MTEPAGILHIVDDADYRPILIRPLEGRKLSLYCVTLQWSVETPTDRSAKRAAQFFVLAEDERGAISQAQCATDTNDWSDAKDVDGKAVPIPFLIRGWSKNLF